MGEIRRAYSPEFKRETVELINKSGKSVTEIASDLGINEHILRRWRREFDKSNESSFPGKGNRTMGSPEEEEIRRLKRELEIVKEERDILKKAVAIFSKTPK